MAKVKLNSVQMTDLRECEPKTGKTVQMGNTRGHRRRDDGRLRGSFAIIVEVGLLIADDPAGCHFGALSGGLVVC